MTGGPEDARSSTEAGEAGVSPELALTEARLAALVNASPLAVIASDLEGRITLWSDIAERIFGWTASEVLGSEHPAVPDEGGSDPDGLPARVLDGKTVHRADARRVTRAGKVIDVTVSAAPVLGARGEVVGMVELVADPSGPEDAARRMESLESQLRQAQKLEVVGRLAAGIAHDFNNLLTAIRGNAELLLTAEETESGFEKELREIARSAERAGALTRQLLSFTHKESVETRSIDVNQLVQGMASLMERLIGETIELRVEVSVGTGSVLTDRNQIEQVLMNLVVNARDALPEGGRITVQTKPVEVTPEEAESLPYEVRPGPYSVITVMDNGVGMHPETADRIFEPFFTTKPTGVGTGLGLSTVYSIVKQTRGHIRVESEPGEGSTFAVYLPQHDTERAREDREETDVATPREGSETILVVEDEAAVLSMAQRTLERQGYEVLPALSGREALAIALKHPREIHVLFCDMVMPDLTGREVADRVTHARPDIRVLMTSGYGERQLAGEGGVGEFDFLPKPYTPRDLVVRIHRTLGQPTEE